MEVVGQEQTLQGQVRQWFVKNDPDHIHVAALLIRFEGCVAKPYQDVAGVWTVGVGHRMGEAAVELANREWTVEEVCAALQHDMHYARARLRDRIWDVMTVKSRQALLALSFNVGSICNTILEHALDDHYYNGTSMRRVVAEWVTYDHASGVEIRGLLRRRLAECAMWVDGEGDRPLAPPGVQLAQAAKESGITE